MSLTLKSLGNIIAFMLFRLILSGFLIFSFSSCTGEITILKGTEKELYDSIIEEINKERKYLILGGTDYKKVEHLVTTLQIRYPYSQYTREVYLFQGDVSYKRKRHATAIRHYKEFVKNQINHPKINYATFKIFDSYSKLIKNTDKDIGPALDVIDAYRSLSDSYLNSEFMEATTTIYNSARKFVLKRTIYISRFYIQKKEFESAYSRIENANVAIPDLVQNSYEAQYLKILCMSKIEDDDSLIKNLINAYKIKFPKSPFLDDLSEI